MRHTKSRRQQTPQPTERMRHMAFNYTSRMLAERFLHTGQCDVGIVSSLKEALMATCVHQSIKYPQSNKKHNPFDIVLSQNLLTKTMTCCVPLCFRAKTSRAGQPMYCTNYLLSHTSVTANPKACHLCMPGTTLIRRGRTSM